MMALVEQILGSRISKVAPEVCTVKVMQSW